MRSILNRFFRTLFTGIPAYLGWALAQAVLALCFPFFLLLEAAGKPEWVRRFSVGFIRWFFLKYLPAVRMYRVEPTPDVRALSSLKQCLMTVNHTSWLDALILLAAVPDVRLLVSKKYGKVPLVSRLMRMLGCIFVDRSSRESVTSAVSALREVLASGGTLAVFPEGTRAQKGTLKPFREVFFALAVEADVEVVPVILYLDTPFLGPSTENFLTERCATLKIRVLDGLKAERGEKGRDLAFRVRRLMKRTVSKLDTTPAA